MLSWTKFATKNMGWFVGSAISGISAATAAYFSAPAWLPPVFLTAGSVFIGGFVWSTIEQAHSDSSLIYEALETAETEEKDGEDVKIKFGNNSTYASIAKIGKFFATTAAVANAANVVKTAQVGQESLSEVKYTNDAVSATAAAFAFGALTLLTNRLGTLKEKQHQREVKALRAQLNTPLDTKENKFNDADDLATLSTKATGGRVSENNIFSELPDTVRRRPSKEGSEATPLRPAVSEMTKP